MKKVYVAPQYDVKTFINVDTGICAAGVSMPSNWDDLSPDEE